MSKGNAAYVWFALSVLVVLAVAGGCKPAPVAQEGNTPPDTQTTTAPPAAGGEETAGPAAVGKPAPDFSVTDVDGGPHSLASYRGRILVVDFWATYCKPCVKKLREYESIYQAMKSKEVDFLALSSDTDDAVIKGWRKENGVTIPLARMDDATREAFFGPVQFVTIPQMRIVDRKGVIRYSFGPDGTVAEVEEALKTLVAEK